MKAYFNAILVLLLSLHPLFADEQGIIVRPAGEELIQTLPGMSVTTVFRVTNNESRNLELIEQPELPENWKTISPAFPFILNAGASDIRLLSFLIPLSTPSGQYTVTLAVRSREFPSISDRFPVQVQIMPSMGVNVQALDVPKFCIAGESYTTVFLVKYEGNVQDELVLEAKSLEDYPVSIESDSIPSRTGQIRKVGITVQTRSDLRDFMTHTVKLTAHLKDHTEIQAGKLSTVRIIPRIMGVTDRFHRLPVQASVREVLQKNRSTVSGFQFDIQGNGTIDDKGDYRLMFRARTPDIYEKSILTEHDELFMRMEAKNMGVHLGDRVYTLSPLTEYARYGRGVEGWYAYRGFVAGGYFHQTRWAEPEQKQWSSYLRFPDFKGQKISLLYYDKIRSAESKGIVSMELKSRFFASDELELEYALDREQDGWSKAWRFRWAGQIQRWTYLFNVIHSSPRFSGYYRDTEYHHGTIAFKASSKISLKTAFRRDRQNIDEDTTRYTSPYRMQFSAGALLRLRKNLHMNLDYMERSEEDRLPVKKFDYTDRYLRLSWNQYFSRLNFSADIEYGKTFNHILAMRFPMERYMASLHFKPDSRQYYQGYLYYDNARRSLFEEQKRWTSGFQVSLQFTKKTTFIMHFQSNYSPEEYYQDRNIFEVRLRQTLPNDHLLSLQCRHTLMKNTLDDKETAFLAEYRMPLNVPVSKKKQVGGLKGRVYNSLTGEAIEDLIFRISGFSAVTDKKGIFSFPSLTPGGYLLSCEESALAIQGLITENADIPAMVTAGEEARIEIPVTRSAQLKGHVLMSLKEPAMGLSERLTEAGTDTAFKGLENILLELRREGEVLYRITDERGFFDYERIRPGQWLIKTIAELSDNHTFEKEEISIEVKPGESAKVDFRAVPKKRSIRMLEIGGTIDRSRSPVLAQNTTGSRKTDQRHPTKQQSKIKDNYLENRVLRDLNTEVLPPSENGNSGNPVSGQTDDRNELTDRNHDIIPNLTGISTDGTDFLSIRMHESILSSNHLEEDIRNTSLNMNNPGAEISENLNSGDKEDDTVQGTGTDPVFLQDTIADSGSFAFINPDYAAYIGDQNGWDIPSIPFENSMNGPQYTALIHDISEYDPSGVHMDTIHLLLSEPFRDKIRILPDSALLNTEDSMEIEADRYDQNLSSLSFIPVWDSADALTGSSGTHVAEDQTENSGLIAADRDGFYRDTAGNSISGRTEVNELNDNATRGFHLSQNYPNPFNQETVIQYQIPRKANVTITVNDLQGREVARLVDTNKEAGDYFIQWDGRNEYGNSIASGIYLYKITAVANQVYYHDTRKMILVR